jgi:hypothetical protein
LPGAGILEAAFSTRLAFIPAAFLAAFLADRIPVAG